MDVCMYVCMYVSMYVCMYNIGAYVKYIVTCNLQYVKCQNVLGRNHEGELTFLSL